MSQQQPHRLAGEPALCLYNATYVEIEDVWAETPLVFQCWAEDTAHATEQCEDAYPGCKVTHVELASA